MTTADVLNAAVLEVDELQLPEFSQIFRHSVERFVFCFNALEVINGGSWWKIFRIFNVNFVGIFVVAWKCLGDLLDLTAGNSYSQVIDDVFEKTFDVD